MKKRPKIVNSPAKKSRRLLAVIIILAATAIIATGAVTVVSRRQAVAQSGGQQGKAPLNKVSRNSVPVQVAGQDGQADAQTGQMKELTPEEAEKLAAGLRQVINRSTEGLVEEQHPDGSISVDLDGRFQNVIVARRNQDGSVSTACVDNTRSAGEFFGIDPQLIENGPDGNRTSTKRPRTFRSANQDQ